MVTWERSLLHRILTVHNYASALSLLPHTHTHTAARHVSHTRHIRLRQQCAVIPYPHQSISISLVVVGAQIRANSLKKQERQQLKSSLLQLSSGTVRGGDGDGEGDAAEAEAVAGGNRQVMKYGSYMKLD